MDRREVAATEHQVSLDAPTLVRCGFSNDVRLCLEIRDHGAMEIPDLPATTILMVEVGSTAHGTGIEGGEDHDQLAVVVETPDQVLGLDPHGFQTVMQRTQPEGARSGPGDIDRTLHSLRRFVRLAASGNPSILMAMWAPVEYSVPIGEELRSLGDAFVGRHVVPRYRGYMQSQARRLLGLSGGGHGQRGGGRREELIAEFGFDTKYAMHCARLGFQCLELLRSGGLRLPIQGEPAEWLRAVRYGQVAFDDWWSRSLALDAELGVIGMDESIRPGPDRRRIDSWCVDAHQRVWASLA
jgi:hypothetical protein